MAIFFLNCHGTSYEYFDGAFDQAKAIAGSKLIFIKFYTCYSYIKSTSLAIFKVAFNFSFHSVIIRTRNYVFLLSSISKNIAKSKNCTPIINKSAQRIA